MYKAQIGANKYFRRNNLIWHNTFNAVNVLIFKYSFFFLNSVHLIPWSGTPVCGFTPVTDYFPNSRKRSLEDYMKHRHGVLASSATYRPPDHAHLNQELPRSPNRIIAQQRHQVRKRLALNLSVSWRWSHWRGGCTSSLNRHVNTD
jgi:hypothetical protein